MASHNNDFFLDDEIGNKTMPSPEAGVKTTTLDEPRTIVGHDQFVQHSDESNIHTPTGANDTTNLQLVEVGQMDRKRLDFGLMGEEEPSAQSNDTEEKESDNTGSSEQSIPPSQHVRYLSACRRL